MQRAATPRRFAAKNVRTMTALKVLGSTLVLVVLLSFDYGGVAISKTLLVAPVQLVLAAFIDTMLLSYFVVSSRWTGWREWGAVFAVFYGVNYLLTAMESVYLGSIFSSSVAFSLVVNGAIASGVFAAALVWVWGKRGVQNQGPNTRLLMPGREWAWKIVGAGVVYLLLFTLFGFAVYLPLAGFLDPKALAVEQSIAASSAAFVFPLEAFRGAFWALLAAPAIIALRFGWKKTGLVMGLLFAVPVSGDIALSTLMTPGLQIAHLAEVFGENLAFGLLMAWIFHFRSRLPPLAESRP